MNGKLVWRAAQVPFALVEGPCTGHPLTSGRLNQDMFFPHGV
jgi:hypothetical protein